MNTTPFDTQQVCNDLLTELHQEERKLTETSDVGAMTEIAESMRWLINKIEFLGSPIYQERKQKAMQSHRGTMSHKGMI